MTRTSSDLKLKKIHEDIIKMGSIVEKQIFLSIEALKSKDVDLANETIKKDDLVDNLQKQIEEDCIKFIAAEQPLAVDLRDIFTAAKIVTDLERMADHAVDICKIVKRTKDQKHVKELKDIGEIAAKVQNMIKLSIDAYIALDEKKALSICKMDDEIDALYKKVFEELLGIMSNQSEHIGQSAQLLFVCKYLERIADHVTNVCEWTIYLKTGKYVDLNE
ncbi:MULTISPECIES: phosphate signaling complex protein PhoU [Clostridium]|uniref:Phosphate-specific transport system accessory protein PhoU n=1 Tax=Clostridium paridis TaxID=2803863 RepID=A0A937K449_9CLOT|nr:MULTISPECIES: phosphate signaling complex protein PhoU [Clostridium]MBL4930795.1 phosphate signaling complex protein PhoU [Clostridium paridis]